MNTQPCSHNIYLSVGPESLFDIPRSDVSRKLKHELLFLYSQLADVRYLDENVSVGR